MVTSLSEGTEISENSLQKIRKVLSLEAVEETQSSPVLSYSSSAPRLPTATNTHTHTPFAVQPAALLSSCQFNDAKAVALPSLGGGENP